MDRLLQMTLRQKSKESPLAGTEFLNKQVLQESRQ